MKPNFGLRRDVQEVINRRYIASRSLRYLYTMWWLRENGHLQPDDPDWTAAVEFENRLRKALRERDSSFLRRLLKVQRPVKMSLAYHASILWTKCAEAQELETKLRKFYPAKKFPEREWEKFKRKYKPRPFSGSPDKGS